MLPDRIIDPNRDVRRIITGVCVVVISLGFAFLVSFPLDIAKLIYLILLFVSGIGCILLCRLCYPYTVLSHEGVTTRFLFKEKLYCWDEIIQVGRYWGDRRSPASMRFQLVLVFTNGSPKQPGRDKRFFDRNLMKAVSLPNQREIRLFIEENYGPLNYDDYDCVNSWEKKAYKLDET